jgi:hypothetical protein
MVFAVLSAPALAGAGPITVGSWSTTPPADNNLDPFYDGRSWDCYTCGVGYVLESYGPMEYLHGADGGAVAFSFDDPSISWSLVSSQTSWTGGIFEYNNGSFTYDNRHGGVYDSLTSPWQFALFRQVAADFTYYFLGVEDISIAALRNDRDYNDFVVRFALPNPSLPDPESDPPKSVPEPSTVLLMGTALVVGAAARRLKARRRRDQGLRRND